MFAALSTLPTSAEAQVKTQRKGWITPSTGPNSAQQTQIDRRFGMFIHFGINTYSGKEWTEGTRLPSTYNPTKLDTDQWAKAARDAGMTYVILIAKHHEGFCLWDSPATEYDVGSSPVTTDVVAAMAESCRKYGIELGLYYSLWDRNWRDGIMRHSGSLDFDEQTSLDYLSYMNGQIKELLTNYGDVCELWLDGGWVLPREDWHIPEVYKLVKKLQPDCLVGVNWSIGLHENPDFHAVRPAGYKKGLPIRYFPSDFRLGDPMLPVFPDPKLYSGPDKQLYYMPFETTVTLNTHWFWHPYDEGLKSVDELEVMYEHSTAQDNVLILNSPPNRFGLMDEHNVVRLHEAAARLGANPGKPIPRNLLAGASVSADSEAADAPASGAVDGNPETHWAAGKTQAAMTFKLASEQSIDRIRIREFKAASGFAIQEFVLEALVNGSWRGVYEGTEVGTSLLIRIPTVEASQLRIRVLKASSQPRLSHVAAHSPDEAPGTERSGSAVPFSDARSSSGGGLS
jgi:alpha-L-fucosidase